MEEKDGESKAPTIEELRAQFELTKKKNEDSMRADRNERKRKYAEEVEQKSRNAFALEHGKKWKPLLINAPQLQLPLVVGSGSKKKREKNGISVVPTTFDTRWQAEQDTRARNAKEKRLMVFTEMKHDSLVAVCKFKDDTGCPYCAHFRRSAETNRFELKKYEPHHNECAQKAIDSGMVPYKTEQLAHMKEVLDMVDEDTKVKSRVLIPVLQRVCGFVPTPEKAACVKRGALEKLKGDLHLKLQQLPALVDLLKEKYNCTCDLHFSNGETMRKNRIECARYEHDQYQKSIAEDERAPFDPSSVDLSDIRDTIEIDGQQLPAKYYESMSVVPSTAKDFIRCMEPYVASDGAHLEGKSGDSFGTLLSTVGYSTNRDLILVGATHVAQNESEDSWTRHHLCLKRACAVDDDDAGDLDFISWIDRSSTIHSTDGEKGLVPALRKTMQNAVHYRDPNHLEKNMQTALSGISRAQKAIDIACYKSAVEARTTSKVNSILSGLSPQAQNYLGVYEKKQLYQAFWPRQLLLKIKTTQGAEAKNSADNANGVRATSPASIIMAALKAEQKKIARDAVASNRCASPLPPRIESDVAEVAKKAENYYVQWENLETKRIASVRSQRNPAIKYDIRLPSSITPNMMPPICPCGYHTSGIPCYHGAAAISDKFGVNRLYEFVHPNLRASFWKEQYKNMQLDLPSTAEIDALPADPTICFPVALLPPKGRPSKNPGKRLHSSREDGTKVKKPRCCGLCKAHNHTKANRPFKQ
mmetsp:Transcript_11872/g.14473  ORF Transcript_11872/g.14473 Transcript_11872/m.14473 type:complete len:757 (-) Transcript_11872:1541-3811(-)